MTDIRGTCDPAFKSVRDVFASTFAAEPPYRNAGASLCIYVGGQCVVDIHGGEATARQAWTADTLVNIWSATKGVVAIAVAMLVDKGLLSYTERVATYWPEFAQAGKADITVAQLMSHQAGLNGYVEPTTLADLHHWQVATSRLAAQAPFWPPGTATSYHAVTYGFLAGELVRRVSGKNIGRFLAEQISAPLQTDIFIGVPENERRRISPVRGPKAARALSEGMNPIARRAVTNPTLTAELPNNTTWVAAELPAVNGHATATGLARLYGALANGGRLGSVAIMSREGVEQMRQPLSARPDLMLGARTWAAGVVLNTEANFGPNPRAFGHAGWGGSFGCADPERNLGVGYVHNQMGPDVVNDPRGISLCDALYKCLDESL
jgi:CubicO group peptidase (beta-lactamase class C family)